MRLSNLFTTSVGKKFWVAITGLGMGAFVLSHMAANLLIPINAEMYNKYSHALLTNPALLYTAEALLVLALLVHVYFAVSLSLQNKAARGHSPVGGSADKRGDFASQSMIYTGLLLLVFVPLHLWTFKYGPHYEIAYDGVMMRDLHRLVIERFSEVGYVVYYLFSMAVLLVHLSHGFAATMQSLGWNNVRNPALKKASWALAAVIAVGFVASPIYVLLSAGGK